MSLVQMSFTGGVFILAVLAVRGLLLDRLPKKTFYILWLAVLIRLLVPFSFSAPVSVYTLAPGSGITMARILREDGLSPWIAGIKGTERLYGENVNSAGRYAGENRPAADGDGLSGKNGEGGASAGVITEDARPPVFGLWVWTVLWAAGVCLGAGFFACMYIRCWREFATSLPAEHEAARKWQEKRRSRRNIVIRQSDRVGSPLSYGILRPVILMPKNTDWADRSRLFYVWEHEYVHIRRLDAAVKLFLTAALCLHWFNPLVWVMYALFNRDMELSCDEAVVRRLGREARAAYAMTLIAMAEKQSGPGFLYSGFSKNVMEGRIRSIMKIRKQSVWTTIAAVLLTGTVCLVFATSPSAGIAETGGNQYGTVNADPTEGADDVIEEVRNGGEITEDVTALERMEKEVGYDREAILARIAEIDGVIEQMNVDESDYTETLSEEKVALEGMLYELDQQTFDETGYGAYGVSYHLPEGRLYKDGKEVKSFYDEKEGGHLWWDNEGAVIVEVIRDEAGEILRLSETDAGDRVWQDDGTDGSTERGEAGAGGARNGGAADAQQAVLADSVRDMHEWTRDLVYNIAHSERFSEYEECGLSYDEASGYMMYAGEKVGRFKDEWEPGTYTLYTDPTGEVAIEISRDVDGKISGITADDLDALLLQEPTEEADILDREK